MEPTPLEENMAMDAPILADDDDDDDEGRGPNLVS